MLNYGFCLEMMCGQKEEIEVCNLFEKPDFSEGSADNLYGNISEPPTNEPESGDLVYIYIF